MARVYNATAYFVTTNGLACYPVSLMNHSKIHHAIVLIWCASAVSSVGCGKDDVAETGEEAARYVSISVGDSHVCLLGTDGLVDCFGDGFLGETLAPSTEFVQIDGGLHHSCGLTPDSKVECWGFDGFAQLNSTLWPLSGVSAGGYHTCAIGDQNQVECWGGVRDGEADPQTGEFLSVSGGEGHTCAINVSNEVECWGLDDNMQASPPDGAFTTVSSGWTHSCAINNSGNVVCWGEDFDGETIAPEGTFTDVRAGKHFSCGLLDSGFVECWGKNAEGQASPPSGQYMGLDVGGDFACALDLAGQPHCWGSVPGDVAQQVVLGDGFSVEGVAWNFGDYNWAEQGMCASVVETDAVLFGGEPVVKGESIIRSAGAFSIPDVISESVLGLFVVVHDCDGAGDVVPTGTGIPPHDFSELVGGDTLINRLSLVMGRDLVALMDDELELNMGIEEGGAMFGFVRNTDGEYIEGATIACESLECPEVYYLDSDHSDGMFSTDGVLNTSTDASAESAFITPLAPLQTYTAEADGLNFRPEFFGSSSGFITVITFFGD